MHRGIQHWKISLIVVLAVVAVVLTGLRLTGTGAGRAAVHPEEIGRTVEKVLAERRAETAGSRVWKVRFTGTTFTRTEQRVMVPREFDTIEFNHVLGRRLAPLGANVVATERTKEATVTMHVVAGGATIYSLSLVTDPEFHSKEKTH
jgi:hypothetical protein